MDAITEVFLEAWDDAEVARQKRDQRVAELEGQGWHCTTGRFYNALTGQRIYLVEATLPPPDSSAARPPRSTRSPRSVSTKARPAAYENR